MEKYSQYIINKSDEMSFIENKIGSLIDIPPCIINAIIENYELFIDLSEIELFLTWKSFDALDHPFNKGVVVYFEQLKLYCATDHKTYLELSELLSKKQYNSDVDELMKDMISEKMSIKGDILTPEEINEIKNSDIKIKKIDMKQIVLTTDKQKIVFAFNSDNGVKLNKFCKILENLTGDKYSKIKTSNIFEITMMNKVFDNKVEADNYVELLKTEVNKINKEFGELMGAIKPTRLFGDFKFCAHDISVIMENPTLQQISDMLKTIPKVNNLIFNTGTIISVGNNNTINTDNMQSRIERWVANNPINGRIKPTDHVKLFNEQNGTNFDVNKWGKYVKNLVCAYKSNGTKYYKNK